MLHRQLRVVLLGVYGAPPVLSPGARSSSPSLSWISKSIRRIHSGWARRRETTPWTVEKSSVARPSDVSSQQLFRGFNTHTHTGAAVPPPMTKSWPHSSHLLLRPWLTCPPNRKIGRLFTNTPWSRAGQHATWSNTYLKPIELQENGLMHLKKNRKRKKEDTCTQISAKINVKRVSCWFEPEWKPACKVTSCTRNKERSRTSPSGSAGHS